MSQYKESVLENGLRVITKEDKNSPIITMGLFVNAGSRYEKEEEWGYAHILEHMLMKGTTKRPSEFWKELNRQGGYSNANTNNERLRFDIIAIKKDAELSFDLLSDLILNATINEKVLENEKKVILEERQKAHENNERQSQSLSREKMFGGHALSREAIGSVESIKGATPQKLKEYLKKFIIPKNSSVVVLGVDSHEEIVRLAAKYFCKWTSDDHLEKRAASEFKVKNNYYFQETKGVNYYLTIGFLAPGAPAAKQNAALSIIANFLGMGSDSILGKELRQKRGLVYSYNVFNNPYTDLGKFNIFTTTSSPVETIKVIFNCIKDLPHSFTPELLEEIKIQMINSFIVKNAAPSVELNFIGNRFILNDRFLLPEEYINILQSLEYTDIVEACKKYLTPENSLTVVLGPKNIKEELGF